MTRTPGILIAAALAALSAAAQATATGGVSIAGAPTVQSGVEVSLNTANDHTGRGQVGSEASLGCWIDHEFFRLSLTAGDKVLITKGSTSLGYLAVGIFPAGT